MKESHEARAKRIVSSWPEWKREAGKISVINKGGCMKKKVVVEQAFCDVCGKGASGYQTCISCGKEFCYDCVKTYAVEYKHAVHFSGSGDGLYCKECDQKLLINRDKLHVAYREIARLRSEESTWYADFKNRCERAEEILKDIPR